MNRFTRKELETMTWYNWLNGEVCKHLEPHTAHLLMRYIDCLKQNQKQPRRRDNMGVYSVDLSELFGYRVYIDGEINEN